MEITNIAGIVLSPCVDETDKFVEQGVTCPPDTLAFRTDTNGATTIRLMTVYSSNHVLVVGVLRGNIVIQNGVITNGLPIHERVERTQLMVYIVRFSLPFADVEHGDIKMAATVSKGAYLPGTLSFDHTRNHSVR